MISDIRNPNEPSIKMDPNDPSIIVAATNLNSYYLSTDTGRTWTTHLLNSTYGVWGDPVIDVDTSGTFYFTHLSNPSSGSWIDRIVCQKSLDSGKTWNNGSFTGLNGTKAQDKQWSIIDRNNNNIYLTWTQFDSYGSSNPLDSSVILFSKSLDNGDTWSNPKRINTVAGDCIDKDSTVEGAVPALGPNGEIYVAWAGPNGIVFNKSLDQGDTWLNNEILVDPMPGGWDYIVPGISRCNGLPITKCDLSGGPNHGTIYVNWTDQRNGVDDTDVWLSKSTDGGNTWTAPVRVNDDGPSKHQFFSWMDVDQTNGKLYFVFYDRRNHAFNETDVFMAHSFDGGASFVNRKISESSFDPIPSVFFGDYTNIVAHNNIIRPIWTRLYQGQLSVWTDVTSYDRIISNEEPIALNNGIHQYPNPASNQSFVSFKLHEASTINLEIYDTHGRKVATVISKEKMGYGTYVIPIEINDLRLKSGLYYPKLQINDKVKEVPILVIK